MPICNMPTKMQGKTQTGEVAQHKDAVSLDNDFLMWSYKVVPCSRRYPHDWASCPCGHKGERAARRDLKTHPYVAIACAYAKQRQTCPRGDSCHHAHNLFEYWLHPQRFRTELCQYGTNCERPVCFFAHELSELRPLDASLPPAETCWSAGAAVSAKAQQQRVPSDQPLAAGHYPHQQQLHSDHKAAATAAAATLAVAAAAAQLQAAASSSGIQQLLVDQLPVANLNIAKSTAMPASNYDNHLLLHRQHLLAMTAVNSNHCLSPTPRLNSQGQQQQQLFGSTLTAAAGSALPMLPLGMPLTASSSSNSLWPPSPQQCQQFLTSGLLQASPELTVELSSNSWSSWSSGSTGISNVATCPGNQLLPGFPAEVSPTAGAAAAAYSCAAAYGTQDRLLSNAATLHRTASSNGTDINIWGPHLGSLLLPGAAGLPGVNPAGHQLAFSCDAALSGLSVYPGDASEIADVLSALHNMQVQQHD